MLTTPQKHTLLAATTGNLVGPTPALYAVFGLVLIPIADQFHWDRAQVSGALGLVSILAGLLNVVVGPMLDRYGARRVALAGSVCFGLALLLLTLTGPNLFQFYALFVLAGVASAFCSSMVFSRLVAGWFDQGRGTALGFTGGVGNGVGSAVLPILAGVAISHFGWRAGYQSVALLILFVGFPVMYRFLHSPPAAVPVDKPQATEQAGSGLAEALRRPLFWMLLFTIGACAACLTAMFSQVVPVLAERGIGMGHAIPVITTFSLVCAGWQWIMGYLLDRFGTPWVMAPFYLLAAVGLVMLQYVTSLPLLLLSGVLLGLGLGTEFGALPLLVSRYFGLRSYGAIAGVMYATITLAQGLVPLAMNAVFDARHTYGPTLVAAEAVICVAAVLLLKLPRFGSGREQAYASTQTPAHPAL